MAQIIPSDVIDGVVVVDPEAHKDQRGRFVETYRRSWFPHGREMIQGNRSDKQSGALVGIHYHLHQADYWYVTRGRIRVVLFDLRVGSPTERTTLSMEIGEHNDGGVFIPPGVGHGFSVLEDCTLTYLVDGYYNPEDELGLAWNDPHIEADWGVIDPFISARDTNNPTLEEIPEGRRPYWGLRT